MPFSNRLIMQVKKFVRDIRQFFQNGQASFGRVFLFGILLGFVLTHLAVGISILLFLCWSIARRDGRWKHICWISFDLANIKLTWWLRAVNWHLSGFPIMHCNMASSNNNNTCGSKYSMVSSMKLLRVGYGDYLFLFAASFSSTFYYRNVIVHCFHHLLK